MLDPVVDSYFDTVDEIEDDIERVEDDVMATPDVETLDRVNRLGVKPRGIRLDSR